MFGKIERLKLARKLRKIGVGNGRERFVIDRKANERGRQMLEESCDE